MITVGVSELKQQTSKILRLVRDEGAIVEITYYGKPIARLVPVTPSASPPEEVAALFVSMEQLAAEVVANWKGSPSAVDAVREGRREL